MNRTQELIAELKELGLTVDFWPATRLDGLEVYRVRASNRQRGVECVSHRAFVPRAGLDTSTDAWLQAPLEQLLEAERERRSVAELRATRGPTELELQLMRAERWGVTIELVPFTKAGRAHPDGSVCVMLKEHGGRSVSESDRRDPAWLEKAIRLTLDSFARDMERKEAMAYMQVPAEDD